jgi:probable HAF family extracellular repeat protein
MNFARHLAAIIRPPKRKSRRYQKFIEGVKIMQTKRFKKGERTEGKSPFFSAALIVVCLALLTQTAAAQLYQVTNLSSNGGTNSRGNSINNRGWIAGYSNFAGNQKRHAALWRQGVLTDLGTLGSPDRNSNVTWSVKNNNGLVVGISQTDTPEPLGESWSCAAFFPFATATGYTCL